MAAADEISVRLGCVLRNAMMTMLLTGLTAVTCQQNSSHGPSQLHLLVDDHYTDNRTGLEFRMHPPKKMGVVLKPDKPWEFAINGGSVLQVSPKLFYLYYMAMGADGTFICLATSTDGVEWDKPELNLRLFDNSTANNILIGMQDPTRQGKNSVGGPGSVWIDTRPGIPSSEKFKMVMQGWGTTSASMVAGEVTVWFSPDGIHNWTTIGKKMDASDTTNIVFWDDAPIEGTPGFVFYGRTHVGNPHLPPTACCSGPNCWPPSRSVGRVFIGADLRNWSGCLSEKDPRVCNTQDIPTIFTADALDSPCLDIYNNGVRKVADAYIMTPKVFEHYPAELAQGRADDGLLSARLAVSRDGKNFSYVSREPFVPLGIGKPRQNFTGVYDGPVDAAVADVVPGHLDVGDETWLYEFGSQKSHNGVLPQLWSPMPGGPWDTGLQRLVLRRNGYVSLSTTSDKWDPAATFQTLPMKLPQCQAPSDGVELLLNANTGGIGVVRVAVVGAEGKPFAGYSLAECRPLMGSFIDERVVWRMRGAEVSHLPPSGGGVRLHFEMRLAELYTFEFRCSE